MNIENLKQAMANCKTDKQALKAIKQAGYTVQRDNTAEIGSFSVWLTNTLRVYKNGRKEYVVQKWEQVEMKYSGIPTFFGTDSIF